MKHSQMYITENSIFYKIPNSLNRKQSLILEGIRYSYNMMILSYEELYNDLLERSKENNNEPLKPFYSAFRNVWSIIDSASRLENLLAELDGGEKNIPPLNLARELRNTFAHIDEKINQVMVDNNVTVWGEIKWIYVVNKNEVSSNILVSGKPINKFKANFLTPLNEQQYKTPINSIILKSVSANRVGKNVNTEHLINISELIEKSEKLIRELETQAYNNLKNYLTKENEGGTDLFVSAKFQINN